MTAPPQTNSGYSFGTTPGQGQGQCNGSIIFLHIGQAGVQCGSSMWELFCQQHNLTLSGKLTDEYKNPILSTRQSQITTNPEEREQQQLNTESNINPNSNQKTSKTLISTRKSKAKRFSNLNLNLNSKSKSKKCDKNTCPLHKNTKNLPSIPLISPFIQNIFMETKTNIYKPRALFFDFEPSAIDSCIRSTRLKKIFHPQQLISGKEDSCCLYSCGYYKYGGEFINVILSRIQTLVESSSSLQGFIILRSLSGGTGSGFTSLLLNKLKEFYPKAERITLDILPSSLANTSSTDPYNVLLSTSNTIDSADLSFPIENDALDSICQNDLFIPSPTYNNYNRLIAQVCSALTSSMQFQGSLNRTLYELKSNCVMYPRLHYSVLSYVPIVSQDQAIMKRLSVTSMLNDLLVEKRGRLICQPQSPQLLLFQQSQRLSSQGRSRSQVEDNLRILGISPGFGPIPGSGPGDSVNISPSNFITNLDLIDIDDSSADVDPLAFVNDNEIHMTYNILYRGAVTSMDVQWTEAALETSDTFRDRVRFVDWTPGVIPCRMKSMAVIHKVQGAKANSKLEPFAKPKLSWKPSPMQFKVGFCNQPPSTLKGENWMAMSNQAAIGMVNSTGISYLWKRLARKFDGLYSKKAFLHWYTMDGMEESEFKDCRNNVQALIQEYEEIERCHRPVDVIDASVENVKTTDARFNNEESTVQLY